MSDNQYRSPKRKLYKNPDEAKICGVCAGIAEYFGFEVWVVRIIAVSLLLLSWFSGTVLLAYGVMCFVLDPKPGSKSRKGCFGRRKQTESYQQREDSARPYRTSVKEVWKAGKSPKDMFDGVEETFSKVEHRLQKLESYVTSSQFELEREFNSMDPK